MKTTFVCLATLFALTTGAQPRPVQDAPFKLVVIPDSQNLGTNDFSAQTLFVETNREVIAMLHVGDVVNGPTIPEWNRKAPGLRLLTNKPFLICSGNHDYDFMLHTNNERGLSVWNSYVPQSLYESKRWWHGGFYSNMTDNCYLCVTNGKVKLLLFALEFGPRTNVLRWASDISAAHPDHVVIIATHNYLMPDGVRNDSGQPYNPHHYGLGDATDGEEMWQCIKSIPNLQFVVCGHQLGVPHLAHTEETGTHGNPVQQFFANWQESTTANLSIWTFQPAKHEVLVETYSPVSGLYDRAATNQLVMPFFPGN